jgi:hypothetical protein
MLLNTQHKIGLELSFGQLKPILNWCEKNCIGEWQYMEDPHGDMYNSWIFFFEQERDYVAFVLWNK